MSPLLPPPAWVEGGCSLGDLAFLVELVRKEQPTTVIEVGVAAGTSSAALLYALDKLPASHERRLYSVDVRPTCYFDPRRRVGSAVAEMYPQHQTRWILETRVGVRTATPVIAPIAPIDFAFVDGNHHHPYPLFDVLHLAPVMRPSAWIALHDIELPRLYPQFPSHGPMWLFEMWPGEKRREPGDAENIGAVQIPVDVRDLVAMAKALLLRPWEQTPTLEEALPLPPCFIPLEGTVLARRRRARPVWSKKQ